MMDDPTTNLSPASRSRKAATGRISRLGVPAALAILLASVFFRFLWLASEPGINGDEAQAANQVILMLHGLPHSFRSPTGQFFNPLMLASWAVEFGVAAPSFFLLRLPAAVWSCGGLALNFWFYNLTFKDRRQALFATTLLACLPLNIAFARLNWDSTYTLVTLNLVFYPLLWLARGNLSARGWALLIFGAALSVWTHGMTAIFTGGMAVSVFWQRRKQIVDSLAARMSIKPSGFLLAGIAASIAIVLSLTMLFLLAVTHRPVSTMGGLASGAEFMALHPLVWIPYVGKLGEFYSGTTAYLEFAGFSTSDLINNWLTLLSLAALIGASAELLCSTDPAEAALARFWLLVPFLLAGTCYLMAMDDAGHERYVLWILPAGSVLWTRATASWARRRGLRPGDIVAGLTVAVSCLFLVQFWRCYFAAIDRETLPSAVGRPYVTAEIEPKQSAADIIARAARESPENAGRAGTASLPVRVYAEDWWSQQPIQFLLGPRFSVIREMMPAPDRLPGETFFMVGFTGSAFTNGARGLLDAAGRQYQMYGSSGPGGQPVLTIFVVPGNAPHG